MLRRGLGLGRVLLFGLLSCSCEDGTEERASAPPTVYPVVVLARRDGQQPLPGVQIFQSDKLLGTSSAAGDVKLELTGQEGTTTELSVKCPETFASPEKPIVVGLRQMAPGSPSPQFTTECVPLFRNVVVGLRTENGANLPVVRLNRVIGRTDELGVAHLLLQGSPGEVVTLTLNTASSPNLRPPNPSLTFSVSERDEIVLLEQKFTVFKPKVRVKRPNIPQPL